MKRLPLVGLATLAVCCGLNACQRSEQSATAANVKTIGFVLSGFDYQLYKTKDGKEECPDGLVFSSKDNWNAQFPTRSARKAQFDRCGAIDRRGPDCEHVLAAPELVKDPLPYREVKGAKSFGLNLDGTTDGRSTGATCAHEKFISPDGTPSVDNQLYRLVGCQKFVHTDLFVPPAIRQAILENRSWRVLLEIRGAKDLHNDPQVDVLIYQGRDPLIVDAENKAVPWQSQRIDEDTAPQHLRGRIVNGELITDPADIPWSNVAIFANAPMTLHQGRLRLRLSETGAQGWRTGYVDATQWWLARKNGGFTGSFTGDSPPALYAALHRLADGHKDPTSGNCDALSSAAKIEFVRAYVRHLSEGDRS